MQSCKKLIFVRPFFFFSLSSHSYHFTFFSSLDNSTTNVPFFSSSFFLLQTHSTANGFYFLFLLAGFFFLSLFFFFFLFSFSFSFFLSFFFRLTPPWSPNQTHKPTSINPQPWLRIGFSLRWMGCVCLTKGFLTCLWWIACWVWTMMVLLVAWDGIFDLWILVSFWVLW